MLEVADSNLLVHTAWRHGSIAGSFYAHVSNHGSECVNTVSMFFLSYGGHVRNARYTAQ